ncbi:MAG: DUF4380 domain-containing protein [Phycisphaerae bacterium]|nr:DUF4380 domain-containing protein [Phycisphaerae bacterium]
MRKIILALSMAFTVLFSGCQSNPQDWSTVHMDNELIDLQLVPEIGGRVLQYKLGDYGFFLVNEDLYGKKPPVSGVGPDDAWLNYGGDKLWLAPQGWDNDQQWPGPPDPVLDGQPYAMETIGPKEIRLTSRKDQRSGVQLSRVIKMYDGTSRVDIAATMKNIDTKSRRWGIWGHTQFNAGNRHGKGHNENYWAYCPLNKNSIFPKGYSVQYGLVNNMSFKPDYDNSMMKVHYQRRVGKIGIDSPAGWVATVDATDGYVFVHRFEYEPGKPYPDNSSVEIWMNGLGEFVAWGRVNKMPEDIKDNPYNFESEVISPYANLKPGEEYTYKYKWYTAKIPTGTGVRDCSDVGVVCEDLAAVRNGKSLKITGKFGVFYEGSLSIHYADSDGKNIHAETIIPKVSPLKEIVLPNTIQAIDNTSSVSLNLYDKTGRDLGQLARVSL